MSVPLLLLFPSLVFAVAVGYLLLSLRPKKKSDKNSGDLTI